MMGVKSVIISIVLVLGLVGVLVNSSDVAYFPDEQNPGQFIKANLEPLNPDEFVSAEDQDPSLVRFLLYTRDNPNEFDELFTDDRESIDESHFRPNFPFKILVHGFTGNYTKAFPHELKDLYLEEDDANVVLVDWSHLSIGPDYFQAVENAKVCSNVTTDFIEFLISENVVQRDMIHIIGFSLGGQVVGQVGHKLKEKVPRITSLDPARPLFDIADPVDKIDPSDAHFVDVMHTAGLTLSFVEPQGHVDFYPNGGLVQPGCGVDPTGACAHSRAPDFTEESIFNPTGFLSYKCDNWENFLNGTCDDNEIAYMGHHTLPTVRGSFFLQTNSEPPYAQN